MVRNWLIIALLLISTVCHAAVELDADNNGAIDITKGGTNASSASAARTALGLGDAATKNVGTTSGTVAAGDDSRFGAGRIAVSGFANFSTAVHDPSTAGKRILIDRPVSCNTLSVPADRGLEIVEGGTINKSGVLTINGGLFAGLYQVFTGSGAVELTNATKVHPEWWQSNDAPGTTDMTAAINSAHVACAKTGFTHSLVNSVVKLSGDYRVTGQITYKAPMYGDSMVSTRILTTENAGGVVVYSIGIDYVDIRDIKIDSFDGTINNFYGIKMEQPTPGYGNHWNMENVLVEHAANGIWIQGWIGRAVRVKTRYCTFGFYGKQLNSCNLNVDAESCNIGIQIADSAGININGVIERNTDGLVIDNSGGINISSYFEANTGYGVRIGRTTECHHIAFVAGSMSGGGLDAYAVKGLKIHPGMSISHTSPVIVGSASRDADLGELLKTVDPTNLTYVQNGFFTAAASMTLPVYNLFPNPAFIGGIRGWKRLYNYAGSGGGGAGTIALETTTTLSGYALRYTIPISSHGTAIWFYMPQAVVDAIKGRTISVLAKVYVPNTVNYDRSSGTSTIFPRVSLTTIGGATAGTSSVGLSQHQAGAWNELTATIAVGTDITDFHVNILSSEGGTSTVENYVIVGEIILYVSPASQTALHQPYYIHPAAGRYEGINWIGTLDNFSFPYTDQTYVIGDGYYNTNQSVLGSGGYVTANQKYVITGWRRITNGTGNVLNTDWVQERILTGQ